MKCFARSLVVAVLASACFLPSAYGADEDRVALEKTSAAIRTAFAKGDVAAVMQYHHPEVAKALAIRSI